MLFSYTCIMLLLHENFGNLAINFSMQEKTFNDIKVLHTSLFETKFARKVIHTPNFTTLIIHNLI